MAKKHIDPHRKSRYNQIEHQHCRQQEVQGQQHWSQVVWLLQIMVVGCISNCITMIVELANPVQIPRIELA